MSPNEISLLSNTSLFGGLESDDLVAGAHACGENHLEKDQTLFRRGDPGPPLFWVGEGRIRLAISSGRGRRLSFQPPPEGDLWGKIAALEGKPKTADATAITKAKVL